MSDSKQQQDESLKEARLAFINRTSMPEGTTDLAKAEFDKVVKLNAYSSMVPDSSYSVIIGGRRINNMFSSVILMADNHASHIKFTCMFMTPSLPLAQHVLVRRSFNKPSSPKWSIEEFGETARAVHEAIDRLIPTASEMTNALFGDLSEILGKEEDLSAMLGLGPDATGEWLKSKEFHELAEVYKVLNPKSTFEPVSDWKLDENLA